jgi:hypothetical protein
VDKKYTIFVSVPLRPYSTLRYQCVDSLPNLALPFDLSKLEELRHEYRN